MAVLNLWKPTRISIFFFGLSCFLLLCSSPSSAGEAFGPMKKEASVGQKAVEPRENTPADKLFNRPNPFALPAEHKKSEFVALYNEGKAAIRSQDWFKAAQVFFAARQSAHKNSHEFRTGFLLGYALFELGEYQQALEALPTKYTDYKAIAEDLQWYRAEAHRLVGNYKNAIANYRAILEKIDKKSRERIKEDPSLSAIRTPLEYYAKVRELECLLKTNNPKTARYRAYRLEKELKEKGGEDAYCLGDLRWIRAQSYRLEGDLNREISLLRNMNQIHHDCFYLDEYEARVNELGQQGVDFEPEYGYAYLTRVSEMMRIWANDEVVRLVDKARRLKPLEMHELDSGIAAKLAWYEGRALLNLQRYKEALAVFKKLYVSESEHADKKDDYLYMIAKTLSKLNRISLSSRTYELVAEKFPKSSLADSAEFLAGWLLGHYPKYYEQADKKLESYRQNHPRSKRAPKALWFRGWFAYRIGDFKKARTLFSQLKEEYPRSGYKRQSTYWIARIHQNLGEYEEAKRHYLTLIEENNYRYYRLAAIGRLKEMVRQGLVEIEADGFKNGAEGVFENDGDKAEMPTPEEAEALAIEVLEKNDIDEGNDADTEGALDGAEEEPDNAAMEEGGEDVRTRFLRSLEEGLGKSGRPPFSLYTYRQEAKKNQQKTRAYFEKRFRRDFSKLKDASEKYESHFPNLRKAFSFELLGMQRQAAQALLRSFDTLVETRREKRYRCRRVRNDEEQKLCKLRSDIYDDIAPKIYRPMLTLFMHWNDWARAHRTYLVGLPRWMKNHLPESIRFALAYPIPFMDAIVKASETHDVPDDLIVSIMRTESLFNPYAVSRMNALGLMQIMPHTGMRIARRMNDNRMYRSRLFNPATSIHYGAWYLGELLKKFQRQLPLAIASYNGGPHNVVIWLERNPKLEWDEWIESIEFVQTRNYVKKVLRTIATYRYIQTGDFSAWDVTLPLIYEYENNINF